ncbi:MULTISPECIES: class I adenylate-forming enzyme family protein [Pseudonocardia]|uniref:Long-chain-fatty-acid--CoA ligase n=2 Tax=Pseudonocardia TaxID=1847 RepID=A0A1Y2MTY1_PSEAH|nr:MULTISPECIES: AMP-binding protein [Pseudonocardia]OSY38674.1 Long-chain-fatty-acid--CoA ligase [Pseudonocardia autotrophica]TDN74876.1 long-chain acyl-CoA synthetase [Pseudonocardia autotrophica]BBF98815.1 long-chain-fatty-acid--CoA ligase [Pseudonocardia autotrophica]GEC26533.1 long-chain-fatty-acid--CoA ligase [Pseudonocardia saturnea]
MSVYDERPWLARYDPGQPADVEPEFGDALAMFAATVARAPEADAIRYFDGRIGFAELDRLTDAFAAGLVAEGFAAGERVAIFTQNVPQFVIAQIGTWKAGGIAVPVNPMYKGRELAGLLADSGASVLVCLQSLHRDVAAGVLPGSAVRTVLTTSELDLHSGTATDVLAGVTRIDCPGTIDLLEFLHRHRGATPPAATTGPDDVAFLTYTSGTTGPPKGAMATHRNVVFNARTYRDWIGLDAGDVVLGVAPLFHITGLVGHVAVTLLTGAPLVLMYRLDPALALRTAERERATFTVGSITVFIALMNAPGAQRSQLATLRKIYSGGAPIPPSTVHAFRETFGHYIHNIYGLTETTSPSHAVPLHAEAPVDDASGALSVGVPVYGTVVRIIDEDGADLAPGEVGELVTAGPQVVAGYWEKPEETARALPGGVLHTGDVGYMDADGWFYIVDRKKDQINAGGYKIWPREVEDVLYEHPAVREAAVVGVPDEYRGETVKAFVSLRADATATPAELIAFAGERMAAYKYPRQVEILDEIPKTASGKVLRRELRGR